MRIIKNCLIQEIGDKKKHSLFVNTLNMFCAILSADEVRTVKKWIKTGTSKEDNEYLYDVFIKNACVVNDSEEEKSYVCRLIDSCRAYHKKCLDEGYRVVFVLSYACNFKCSYCYEKENVNEKYKVLSEEQVDSILQINKDKIKSIDLFGGEPLLLQNRHIIEYIINKAPKVIYSITTNGYYLEEYVDILVNINISYVMVTIDGNAKTHNKSRILKNGNDNYSGSVLYDEISSAEIKDESFYKNVACCFQNDTIFNNWSIVENIMCKSDYTENELHKMVYICEKINLLNDISALERGAETIISEIRDFSYGQRKKILLARALFKEAKVYVLDEPLEGIDKVSEQAIVTYLTEISKDNIIIVSTHKEECFGGINYEIAL